MGVVVAARHLALHQEVAIKILPDEQAKDAESVARFMREARAVVRLKSEHAINYVLQACEAVAEAHALGIIHRDLKPRNLFLSTRRDGKQIVKVLDFGLAKPVAAYGSARLTATSKVLGSPQYMSPEQMRATRDVDYRTDVWSLGVCLYELLTRRLPFEADTVPVLCTLVLKDTPKPVTSHRPDVPLAASPPCSARSRRRASRPARRRSRSSRARRRRERRAVRKGSSSRWSRSSSFSA